MRISGERNNKNMEVEIGLRENRFRTRRKAVVGLPCLHSISLWSVTRHLSDVDNR